MNPHKVFAWSLLLALTVALRNIDMSGVRGLWIPCAGSLSPWNTHLGSMEYEPDARCVVETSCESGAIGLDSMKKKLSRILSLPAGAESTGLQAIDDLNGFAYILSNFQHAGDFSPNIDPALKAQLDPLIDRSEAAIGYLGGIPGLR
jgi:hypothetical protein